MQPSTTISRQLDPAVLRRLSGGANGGGTYVGGASGGGSGNGGGVPGGFGPASTSGAHVIRRSDQPLASSAPPQGDGGSPVVPGGPVGPPAVTSDLIDQIVDRLEARLRDDLERRGRWLPWESL
ncbi:MAG TPA: hypothetical protein VHA73_00905 [Acidimicrobiales bacterium]|nr:hypothetical protein [Acidimicrobiales bacterium]